MRQILLIPLLTITFIISCAQSDNTTSAKLSAIQLSESEKTLMDSIQFDYDILKTVRIYTDSSITILSSSFNFYIDSLQKVETITKNHKGFSLKSDQERARGMVLKLNDQFKEKGYFIYISEQNFGYESDEVSVLKATNQFEILMVEETDGINYGLENKDVIAKLREWNIKYPFQIIGAGFDWVEAIFVKKPSDMKAFSKELYEFCPDIVDQGVGSVKNLETEMNKSDVLYLWWD